MENQITIGPPNSGHRLQITGLLQSVGLPVDDLPPDLSLFFIASDNGVIIGSIGLELYENYGLLRSLAVKPEYRKMKIAASLISQVENLAGSLGIKEIYLLTETAQGYFSKDGYVVSDRSVAPASLRQSSEFSHVCLSTAIFMKKVL